MPIGDTEPPNVDTESTAELVALCGLIAFAVFTRVMASSIWWADAATDPDAYVGIAHGIATDAGFSTPGTNSPTAYRPPLYPLVLSGFAGSLDPFLSWMICYWNTVFAVLLVAMMFCAGRRWGHSRSLSLIVGAILILDPLLLRATPLAMTEPLFTLLTTYAVWMLVASETVWSSPSTGERLPPAPSPPKTGARGPEGKPFLDRSLLPPTRLLTGLGAGMLLGLAALCRPTIWPFIGLYSLGLIVVHRRQWRDVIGPLAAMWLVIAAVVSPWVIRNQLVMGHPILTTTHGGYTLLLGNNPVFYDEVARQPWGTVWDGGSLDRWQRGMLAEMDAELGPNADEIARDRWQAARAWRHITDDPAGFGGAVCYRVRSLWSLSPRGKAGESLPGVVRWLVAAWYAGLFGFAIAGAVIWWRERRPGLWVLLLFIASVQMMHLVYWTDTRMRAPLHPVLAVLAATAVERLWRRWRSLGPPALGATGTALRTRGL